jgi:hypothetical protein
MTDVAVKARTFLDGAGVTRFIKVIAVLSLMAALFTGTRQYQLSDCLARYSEASNISQRARAEATEQDRKALDAMIAAVANARQLPAAQARAVVDAAFADYGKARAFADGSRSVSPIPEPPSAKC